MVVGGPVAAEDKARVDAVSDSDDEDDLINQQLEVVQERWVGLQAGVGWAYRLERGSMHVCSERGDGRGVTCVQGC